MIQFSDSYWRGQRTYHFETRCPVCEMHPVRLAYVYEWEREDYASGTPVWSQAHSPAIVDQDCRCLLGDDFCQDALDSYLDREAYDSRRR